MNRTRVRDWKVRITQVDASCACAKRAYATRNDADRAATIARRRTHEPIHEYRCPDGHWHIGHRGDPK